MSNDKMRELANYLQEPTKSMVLSFFDEVERLETDVKSKQVCLDAALSSLVKRDAEVEQLQHAFDIALHNLANGTRERERLQKVVADMRKLNEEVIQRAISAEAMNKQLAETLSSLLHLAQRGCCDWGISTRIGKLVHSPNCLVGKAVDLLAAYDAWKKEIANA